jgi:glycosyltransferase involved in cell wall biosynthesis
MTAVPHLGFVLERSLGHLTHAETLARTVPLEPGITADVAQIDFTVEGFPARIPGFNSNWTIRSGVRARRVIRGMHRRRRLDALFVHTQVPAVLAPDWVARIPTVVSLDATPLQYDELGAHYGHEVAGRRVEGLKWKATRACFRRSAHIVTWSAWAKDGVVEGYGIDAEKVTVLPPGVSPSLWHLPAPRPTDRGNVRILFVGGDLERKGGDVLLEAFAVLRAELASAPGGVALELDLVTRAEVAPAPGVRVHRDMHPNSPGLIALFHDADIFALPTRGDCLGIVFLEAGAAELPLVATAIAGVPEIVKDGQTGLVVPPGDRDALVDVLRTLVADPELRRRLGTSARQLVDRRFDAVTNTHELVELLCDVAARRAADG